MNSKYIESIIGMILLLFAATSLQAQTLVGERDSYAKAKEMYDKGLYSASYLAFDQHLRTFGKEKATSSEASYYKAVSAVRLSQSDGEALVQSFVENYPDDSRAASAYIELAQYYYQQKAYKKAIAFFEKSPGDPSQHSDKVLFSMGHAYFMEKEYEAALNLFSAVSTKEQLIASAAYFQGYIHYQNGDLDKSIEQLESGFLSDEYGNEALRLYAALRFQQGDHKEIIKVLNDVAPGTTDPELLKVLGDANLELKEYRLAAINYKEYLKRNKRTDAASYYKIGWCFYQLNDTENALENLKKAALAKDTLGAYASYYLGVLYTREENLTFASPAFKKAAASPIEIQEEATYAYGKTEFDLGNYQSAIAALTDYTQKFPNGKHSTPANEMLTQSYLNNKDYDAAIAYIESLGYLSPKIKQAYQRITYQKGTEYFNKKKFANAISLFEKSLKHGSDEVLKQEANYWIGESYSFVKKYAQAVPYYIRSVQLGSELGRYGLAYAYYNQKEYSQAAEHFQAFILRYTPEISNRYHEDALMRAGDCFFVAKDYEKAIVYYNKAASEGAKDLPYIFYQSGVVYRYKGDDANAIRSFEKLVEQYPTSDRVDDALFQVAQITYEKGDYPQAISKFQVYLRKYPDSPYTPYVLLNQAVSHNNLQQHDQAAENYKLLLDRFSRHETANSALLGLQGLAGQGKFDEFSTYLDKYKSANPDSDALENIEFETAKAMYYNLQYDEAIGSFEKFLSSYPGSTLTPDARYFIADAYYRKNDFDKALPGFYAIADNYDYSRYTRVIYRIATIESAQGKHNKAMAYYNQLKNKANSSKETVNALNGLMESHYVLGNYDSTQYYATDLIENRRISNEIESSAMLHLARSQYALGKPDEAFDWFLQLVNTTPDVRGAEAKYYISKIFFDKGDHAQSLKSLFELTDAFTAYDYWMGKAFLLMTDNYIATDELFQAEATLNSLIENSPLEEIKKEARQKQKVLEEAKQKELVTDQTDTLQNTPGQ